MRNDRSALNPAASCVTFRFLHILLLFTLATTHGIAADNRSDAYAEQVQQMYIAYYGRPGDPGGVAYWAGQLAAAGGNWIADLVNAFGNSREYTERFSSLANESLIDNLYQQLFNRSPDPLGLSFYVDLRQGTNHSGFNPGLRRSTLAQIALDIANGAQDRDLLTLEQKRHVSSYFTNEILRTGRSYQSEDIGAAAAIVNLADSGAESLQYAYGAVDDFISGTADGRLFDEIRLAVRVALSFAQQMANNAYEIIEELIVNERCSFHSSFDTQVILEGRSHEVFAQGELSLYRQAGGRLTCDDIARADSLAVDRAELLGSGHLSGAVAHAIFSGDFDIDGGSDLLLDAGYYWLYIADYYYISGHGSFSELRYGEDDYPDVTGYLDRVKMDMAYAIDLAEQILTTGQATFGEMASAIVGGELQATTAHCDSIVIRFTGTPVVQVSASCTSPSTINVDVDTAEIWW